MPDLLIQFLLQQLRDNEENKQNFFKSPLCPFKDNGGWQFTPSYYFETLCTQDQILFVLACLGRTTTQANLAILEGYYMGFVPIVDELNKTFNHLLHNGQDLEVSILALHAKMLELVPQYVEFVKKNNK